MRTYSEKLSSLTEDSVWIFTKQSTDFDDAYRAVQLFAKIPNIQTTNIEHFFEQNFQKYHISTNRHRVLIISQFFGLLTKKTFYSRGTQYSEETPTPVFYAINKFPLGSPGYNRIKSEQLLKVKVKAIIDSTEERKGWNIFPVVFSYLVLKELRHKYHQNSISLSHFYSYVMTASKMSDVDETVDFLKFGHAPESPLVPTYKSRSRIEPLFDKNCSLFLVEDGNISLNPVFEPFVDSFLSRNNVFDWEMKYKSDSSYSEFLYSVQGFNVDLLRNSGNGSSIFTEPSIDEGMVICEESDDTYDAGYQKQIDKTSATVNDVNLAEGAEKTPPQFSSVSEKKHIEKNPIIGRIAIERSLFVCENDPSHVTFPSERSGYPFLEAHHLIPMEFIEVIWEKYKKNIDCLPNIVSLCPTCHRAIHLGDSTTRNGIIEKLYGAKKDGLTAIGIDISLDELKKMY